jgi:CRISPR/Cas system CMR subunit Cmr6 (Cas7 group RAMP superfamily)
MNLKYKLTLHSVWHCGSGESKGADMDALVIKDKNGLPFIPGKTIKGLIKDGMQTVRDYQPELIQEADINSIFGVEGATAGTCFFKNAVLPSEIKDFLASPDGNFYSKYLYTKFSSTAIDSVTGVAEEHSLRSIEVTVPMELEGEIMDIADDYKEKLELALKMIKNLGVGRNKGLGRCTFELKGGKQ